MSAAFKHRVETARPIPRKLPRGTILNRDGQPIVALAAPSGAANPLARLDRLNAAREYLNPLRGLTITRAVHLLEDYQLGRMADLQWTYKFVEQRDPDMIALLDNRIGRLLEMDYNVQVEKDADEILAAEQQECLAEKISLIDNFYEWVGHAAIAKFRGYSHAEKIYGAGDDITHLEIVDQWNVVRDGMKGAWKWNPTAASVDFRGCQGPVLPLERFLYREVDRPINVFALLKMIRASLSDKDWDAFNEIYNIGSGVVIGPPDVDPDDEAEYEVAAQRVAEGGSGYLPNGSEYVPNEMPHDPATFKLRLDHLSEKLVLAGTGGMLTMLAVSGSGTLAGSVHDEVFGRLTRSDARQVSEIINKQLVPELLDRDFRGQPHVAYFELAANEETNSGAAVDQVSKLSLAGYQVDPAQVTEKTGWTVTLKPVAPALGFGSQLSAPDSSLPIANRLLNRADSIAAGRAMIFRAEALARLTAAQAAQLQPLIARLDVLNALTDETAYDAAARRLQADLPALFAQVNSDPQLADVFEQVYGTSLVSGATEAQAAQVAAVKNRRPSLPATAPAKSPKRVCGYQRGSPRRAPRKPAS